MKLEKSYRRKKEKFLTKLMLILMQKDTTFINACCFHFHLELALIDTYVNNDFWKKKSSWPPFFKKISKKLQAIVFLPKIRCKIAMQKCFDY